MRLTKPVVYVLGNHDFYGAGPTAMVETRRHTLNSAGVDDDDIRSEEFYGY